MTPFEWAATAAILIISSARITRLLIFDKFPPIAAVRDKFIAATDKSETGRKWQIIAFCEYCASFWAAAAVLTWAVLAGVFDPEDSSLSVHAWYYVNGALTAAYLAAMVMVHDGDEGDA